MERPLREHYEVDSDAGIMVRTFDYIADLEKYCTSIESYMLSKISESAAKDQRIKELEKCLKDFVIWTEQIDDDGEGKEDWIILQRAKSLLTPKDKQP
jgi:hypothetical protein